MKTSLVVAICTFNRHEPLIALLNATLVCTDRVAERARVGVVVVDDSIDANARDLVSQFSDRFELGLSYDVSGKQNISLARNKAIEAAVANADWVAMTDDDCEPVPEWLEELLNMQEHTGADAITGPMRRRVPPGSPSWLTEQPFLELGMERPPDGSELSTASTFNSMISGDWLRRHPEIRFKPALGEIGGEDMVFYRAAHAAGLKIRYAEKAVVYENEPAARANLPYQLRLFFWHGNSSYVTSIGSGISSAGMFLHACKSLLLAVSRPLIRLLQGSAPQWRYTLASMLHALGKMSGSFGIRVRHR